MEIAPAVNGRSVQGGAHGRPRGSMPGWWVVLRRAALGLAGHGWPVIRGTYFDGVSWRGRPDAVGLCPVDEDWATAPAASSTQIGQWWDTAPYSVLLGCGRGVDCIELPGLAASRPTVAALLRAGLSPPVMLTPEGRLALFVRTPESGSAPFLVSASVRSAGAWVAAPPTGEASGHRAGDAGRRYRWAPGCSPGELSRRPDWVLPDLAAVAEVITATVSTFTWNDP